ncbi:MAG: hypothetical protein IH937_14690 [Acidobacteria bacterium]|nr:hypothetical protein [Acidobacteriota bacterium]
MNRKVLTIVFIIFFTVPFGWGAEPVPVLGQVISDSVQMDGMSVPSGTTVLNNSLLETTQDPAFIHLGKDRVIELHRNSSAYFEKTSSQAIQVSVRSGTLSYRSAGGELVTSPPESLIVFQVGAEPVAEPQEEGLRVVLVERAATGEDTIQVNDASRIDPRQPILLRSPDGRTQEIHYVEAFDENNVKLISPLENTFEVNTRIIQDPDVVQQAPAAEAAEVGAVAGVSVGTATATAGAEGLSTGAKVAIGLGVAGGATGTAVALSGRGGDEKRVSE